MKRILLALLILACVLPLSSMVVLAQPGDTVAAPLGLPEVKVWSESVNPAGGGETALAQSPLAAVVYKPDLQVSGIVFSPSSPTTQNVITIRATIRNAGNVIARNIVVRFSNGAVIGNKTISSIGPGGIATASITWGPVATAGTYTVNVVVDPDNKISESNENNNAASKLVTVTGPKDTTPPVVKINSPTNLATVNGTVYIVANATDNLGVVSSSVEYRIDSASWTAMSSAGGDTYKANWDSTKVSNASHTITVNAKDAAGNTGQNSVTVTTSNGNVPPPPTAQYQLSIEIDYTPDHAPTQAVLDYIQNYYLNNNLSGERIAVTFTVAPATVPLGVNVSNGISTSEFWAIEAASNGGNDTAHGSPNNGQYYLPEKWVLYGTSVEGSSNTVGYCYVVTSGTDCLAGNYIFIADGTADSWGGTTMATGAEAVVLMHEMGHSIGIAKFDSSNQEIYDPDTSSVMSYLSYSNASLSGNWHYSATYWDTRNLEYYKVS